MMETRLPTQQKAAPPPSFMRVRGGGMLQRKCACGGSAGLTGDCEGCSNDRLKLQRSTANSELETRNSGGVPPIVHEVLRSPGQPLDPETRAFFESRFGHDFSEVRVHDNGSSTESARAVGASAFTVGRDIVFGAGQYAPQTNNGRRLLAHELTHVVQQRTARPDLSLRVVAHSDARETQAEQIAIDVADRGLSLEASPVQSGAAVLRDLAQEPPADAPAQRELTPVQLQRALQYNRASYNEESIRLIQDLVGGPRTGRFEEETVRLVALIQRQFGLVPADGKVGPDTYDFLIRELQAERVAPGACLTLFQIVGPQPLTFFRTSPTQGSISSRQEVHARFDPRCNCGDFEYRQYIGGHVELLEASRPGVTPPATSGCSVLASTLPGTWVWDLDGCFGNLPAGRLTRTMREDGDTAVAAGVAGRHYGHRSARPNPSDGRDRYLPDRTTGCIYEAFDVPDLTPVPATPADTGDIYDWDMRFRGVIQRSDGTIVSEQWWNIIQTIVIP
jgi:hypothetical protein